MSGGDDRPRGGPTVDPEAMQSLEAARRERLLRRVIITIVAVIVAAGAANVLGNRYETAAAVGGGFDLAVDHPSMSRPGLAANWSATVSRSDGTPLPDRLQLESASEYFDLFDQNGIAPAPTQEWNDGERLVWVFEPPPGSTVLTVAIDARLQPDIHRGRPGFTAVVVDGRDVVSVDYTTDVAP